jgi:hypothetical protein
MYGHVAVEFSDSLEQAVKLCRFARPGASIASLYFGIHS